MAQARDGRPRLVALALLLVLALVAPSALAADVLVVDRDLGPGAAFAFPNSAVAAAEPGDVILVREGYYEGILTLGTKPLVVIAETNATVEVDGILIEGLAAGSTVVVRGIDTVGTENLGIVCRNNPGSIWIEDADVDSAFTFLYVAGRVELTDNADVVMKGCRISPPGNATIEDWAIDSLRTRLHLFDSAVFGAFGKDNDGNGKDAIRVRDGFALLSGGTVSAARGGDGNIFRCEGGDGGSAIVVQGATSEVVALGLLLTGGEGGSGYDGCASGAPGEMVVVTSGSFTALPAAARSLSIDGPVRENATLDVTYAGVEGDRVHLFRSAATTPGFGGARFDGAFFLAPPAKRHFRGVIDSSGFIAESFPVPSIGAGARVVFVQAYFDNPVTGESVVGPPSALVILDESID